MSTSRLARITAGVAGAAAVVTVLTLATRLLGFGRWFAQNAWVGPNEIGTAYATANIVPNVLFEVAAGGALAGAIVPVLAGAIAKDLRGDVDRTSSALLTWALVALVPLGALTWLAAPAIMRAMLGGGAAAAQVDLGASLLRMFALQIPLYGVGVVLSGVLQAHRRFIGPALAPLLSSVVVIGAYYAYGLLTADGVTPATLTPQAVAWLGWGTTAGVAALSLPLLVPAWRAGVRLRLTLRFPPGVARRARSLALAGAGGLLAQQLSVLVVARLANGSGGAGVININQYATAVVMLPYAVLAVPLATTLFPRLAEHASTGRHDLLAARTATSTRAIVAVSLAGAAALVAAAWRIEGVFELFARGGAVEGMGVSIAAAALSVLGLALLFHLARVLFALERGRLVLVATSAGWLLVALLALVLVATSGGGAVAVLRSLGLATSIGTLAGGVLLALFIRREVGSPALAGVARTTAVALAGAVVGALAGLGVAGLDGGGLAADLGIGAAAGLVALGVTGGVLALGDRQLLRVVLRRRAPAAAPQAVPAPTAPTAMTGTTTPPPTVAAPGTPDGDERP